MTGPADRGPRVAMLDGWVALRARSPAQLAAGVETYDVEAVGGAVWIDELYYGPPCARHDQVVALTEDSVPTTVGSAEDGMKLLLVPFRAVLAVVLW